MQSHQQCIYKENRDSRNRRFRRNSREEDLQVSISEKEATEKSEKQSRRIADRASDCGPADSRTVAGGGRTSSPIMTPTSKTMPRIYTFHKRKLTRRYIVCSGERRNRNFILLINRGQSATIAKITAFSNLKYGPD